MSVITRFPPSPTGYLHIGSARTALFNYLFTKHEGGTIYLRFEDTDKERSKKEFEQDIVEGLAWLGLNCESPEKPRQSERTDLYRNYLKNLVASGAAYEAEPAAGDENRKVIRFKNPNVKVTFEDLIRGTVTFDTSDLGDFVVAKGMDDPLYHLAVVVDDFDMGITHVIRGEDHISNTPRQILIQEALGFPRPQYAHIPLILAADRSKLSKRHGAVSVTEYREKGYLPEAFLNYLALLGWNPGSDEELFTLEELVTRFSLDQVQKSGAIFSEEKLRWFNKEHIKRLPEAELTARVVERLPKYLHEKPHFTERLARALPVITEHIHTFKEVTELADAGEFAYFFSEPEYQASGLSWKNETDPEAIGRRLERVKSLLQALKQAFPSPEEAKTAIFPYAEEEGRGAVLWPLRYALSGREKSADPFTIISVIGTQNAEARIDAALLKLKN